MKKTITLLIFYSLLFCTTKYYAQTTTVCGNDSIKLKIQDYKYGVLEWEKSSDAIHWEKIRNEHDTTYVFNPEETAYYRAVNKSPNCEPIFSSQTLIQKSPTAIAGGDRLVKVNNIDDTFLFLGGNTETGSTGTWSVLEGSGGVFSDINNPLTKFSGTTGDYKLQWKLENSCGVSRDSLIVKFENYPTDITLSRDSIAENSGANALVGRFTTVDQDADNSFTYRIIGLDSPFNITGDSLRLTASADFETSPNSYQIEIESSDKRGGALRETFTIVITDINEPPTSISLSQKTIAENSGANALVGRFTTVDQDADNSFTYRIIGSNSPFNITGDSLRLTASADFETLPNTYQIEIESSDKRRGILRETFEIRITDVNDYPILIKVTGGTFIMGRRSGLGDSDELPTHSVTLSDYSIGQTEVTVAQYRLYTTETAGVSMPIAPSWGWNDNDPMVYVNWNDAKKYCTWLSGKLNKTITLPTEAQWEFAARGGNQSNVYKYSGSNTLSTVTWYRDNSSINGNRKTHRVAQKNANELGLYDMSGNVWEWCLDWYSINYYSNSPNKNPQGPSTGDYKVLRGGSWSNLPYQCRVPFRDDWFPTGRFDDYGFRVVSF